MLQVSLKRVGLPYGLGSGEVRIIAEGEGFSVVVDNDNYYVSPTDAARLVPFLEYWRVRLNRKRKTYRKRKSA